MNDSANTVWIKAFSADGYQLGITLEVDPANVGASVAQYLASLKAAGLTPRELGIEEGEQVEACSAISRRSKANKDGTTTPIIDLFVGELEYKTLSVYLNTDEDVAAFESAFGIALRELPEYDSEAAVKRTDTARFSKYARRPVKPVRFVHEKNPAYTGAEGEMKPKRRFVRWMSEASPQRPTPAPQPLTVVQGGKAATRSDELFQQMESERSAAITTAVSGDGTFLCNRIERKQSKDNKTRWLDFLATEPKDGSAIAFSRSETPGLKDSIHAEHYNLLEHNGTVFVETIRVFYKNEKNGEKEFRKVVRVAVAEAEAVAT